MTENMQDISTAPEVESQESDSPQTEVDVFEMDSQEFNEKLNALDNLSGVEESSTQEDASESDTEPEATEEDSNKDLDALYKEQLEKGYELKEPLLVKVNGEVFEVNKGNELKNIVERGLHYTQRMQEIAKHKDTIKFLQENGIEDVNTLAEALQQGIDVRKPEEVNTPEAKANEIAKEILESDYADEMKNIVGSLPPQVHEDFAKNPDILQGLFVDVKSGIAQKILPVAKRLISLHNMPFVEAYIQAGNQVIGNAKTNTNGGSDNSQKLMSEPKQRGGVKKSSYTQEDIFSMSEDEFQRALEKLQ